jgi:hypothetical protein
MGVLSMVEVDVPENPENLVFWSLVRSDVERGDTMLEGVCRVVASIGFGGGSIGWGCSQPDMTP